MRRGLYDLLDGSQPCQLNPDLFVPGRGHPGSNTRAKAICRLCHFREPCLQYALLFDLYGIWGATTQRERRTYQRAAGMRPEPVTIPSALGRERHASKRPTARPAPAAGEHQPVTPEQAAHNREVLDMAVSRRAPRTPNRNGTK